VAHNVLIGEHTIIAAQTGISGSSTVGKNVVIAGQVGISDGCEVRDGAILGAQSGLPTGKKVPAGEVFWGSPARPLAKAKEQFAWAARLPELAERLQKLEQQLAEMQTGGRN
jgi:UDP-3-O-[3-hydroxymyristoyl] glucosamine N-acyltransferase